MIALRSISLALALAGVLALGMGTVGFSDVTADRSVGVAVVDDDDAYVGYDTTDITAVAEQHVDLVTITNRLPSSEPIEVTAVDVDVSGAEGVRIGSVGDPSIDPGTSSAITARLEQCSPNSEATVEVTVEVAGDGLSAEVFGDSTTRQFELTCKAPEVTGVRFNAQGTVVVNAESDGTIPRDDVTVWVLDDGNVSTQPLSGDLQTDTPVNGQLEPPNDPTVVALAFEDSAYVHPQLENRTIATPRNKKSDIEVGPGVDREFLASFSAAERSE